VCGAAQRGMFMPVEYLKLAWVAARMSFAWLPLSCAAYDECAKAANPCQITCLGF
jgi:hypothetical protein